MIINSIIGEVLQYKIIPKIRTIDSAILQMNYYQIKQQDLQEIKS